jgi:hypothetical protein
MSQGVAVGGERLAALPLLLGPTVFQGFLRQDLATRRHADAVTRLAWRPNPAMHRAPPPPAPRDAGAIRIRTRERVFVHVRQVPGRVTRRLAKPVVGRGVGEGLGPIVALTDDQLRRLQLEFLAVTLLLRHDEHAPFGSKIACKFLHAPCPPFVGQVKMPRDTCSSSCDSFLLPFQCLGQ